MQEINQQNNKLGRGLSSLIGGAPRRGDALNNSGGQKSEFIQNISLTQIIAGIYQPRRLFDEDELNDLANSIKENGVIQPIILRRNAGLYEIIAGERRFRAAKIAGIKEIPSIIKDVSNLEALELALIENIQRSDLSLIEEAAGYKQLISEFSYSQEEIAKRVGKSRSHVTNLLRLLSLPDKVKDLLDEKILSMGHARAIISSKNPEELAEKIVNLSLNVRDTEELVRHDKEEAKIKNTPAFLMNGSDVRYISTDLLKKVQEELSGYLEMAAKITYNPKKKKGKITIEFSEFSKIQHLISKIGANSQS